MAAKVRLEVRYIGTASDVRAPRLEKQRDGRNRVWPWCEGSSGVG